MGGRCPGFCRQTDGAGPSGESLLASGGDVWSSPPRWGNEFVRDVDHMEFYAALLAFASVLA
jgi:hypothetical protein